MYYKLELTMYYRLELTMYYYCLWYDKLWGPSQRVVTLFRKVFILFYIWLLHIKREGRFC